METDSTASASNSQSKVSRKRAHPGSDDVTDSPQLSSGGVTCSGSPVRREIRLTSVLSLRKHIDANVHRGTTAIASIFKYCDQNVSNSVFRCWIGIEL